MDIIKIGNSSYAKYEEVLLRRDNVRKEAEQNQLEYIKAFGDLMTESFRLKIECIKKKKMISFCQRQMNLGKDISSPALTAFIEKEMAQYQKDLAAMIKEVNDLRAADEVSDERLRKIKKIYYALVKLIHPDMHPEFAADEKLKDYWEEVSIAYRCNNLDELKSLDALVRMYLNEHGLGDGVEPEIEDVETRIAEAEQEIERIISQNPYLYKLLLADPKEIEEEKQEYQDEIDSYKKYSKELDDVLSTFEIQEMLS